MTGPVSSPTDALAFRPAGGGELVGGPFVIDPRARRAWPWLPPFSQARRVLVGPTGELLRVSEAGHLDFVERGSMPGWRSIASDPVPKREAS